MFADVGWRESSSGIWTNGNAFVKVVGDVVVFPSSSYDLETDLGVGLAGTTIMGEMDDRLGGSRSGWNLW